MNEKPDKMDMVHDILVNIVDELSEQMKVLKEFGDELNSFGNFSQIDPVTKCREISLVNNEFQIIPLTHVDGDGVGVGVLPECSSNSSSVSDEDLPSSSPQHGITFFEENGLHMKIQRVNDYDNTSVSSDESENESGGSKMLNQLSSEGTDDEFSTHSNMSTAEIFKVENVFQQQPDSNLAETITTAESLNVSQPYSDLKSAETVITPPLGFLTDRNIFQPNSDSNSTNVTAMTHHCRVCKISSGIKNCLKRHPFAVKKRNGGNIGQQHRNQNFPDEIKVEILQYFNDPNLLTEENSTENNGDDELRRSLNLVSAELPCSGKTADFMAICVPQPAHQFTGVVKIEKQIFGSYSDLPIVVEPYSYSVPNVTTHRCTVCKFSPNFDHCLQHHPFALKKHGKPKLITCYRCCKTYIGDKWKHRQVDCMRKSSTEHIDETVADVIESVMRGVRKTATTNSGKILRRKLPAKKPLKKRTTVSNSIQAVLSRALVHKAARNRRYKRRFPAQTIAVTDPLNLEQSFVEICILLENTTVMEVYRDAEFRKDRLDCPICRTSIVAVAALEHVIQTHTALTNYQRLVTCPFCHVQLRSFHCIAYHALSMHIWRNQSGKVIKLKRDERHVIDEDNALEERAAPSNGEINLQPVTFASFEDSDWIECCTCGKWRRIPSGHPVVGEDEEWFCKDNPDSNYNDCSIPEEQIKAGEIEFANNQASQKKKKQKISHALPKGNKKPILKMQVKQEKSTNHKQPLPVETVRVVGSNDENANFKFAKISDSNIELENMNDEREF